VIGFGTYFGLVVAIPMGFLAWTSLQDAFLLRNVFIGLNNYSALLADPIVLRSFGVTLEYAAMTVPLQVVLGFGLASLLFYGIRSSRIRTFLAGFFFLPVVTPVAVIATVWKFVLLPTENGLLNSIIVAVGGQPVHWLVSPETALLGLAMTHWIPGTGLAAILFLAGLTALPREVDEAACIDGAGPLARLRFVTFPLMIPTVALVWIVELTSAAQMFVPVLVMTGGDISTFLPKGGPDFATHTYVWNLYLNGFQYYREGFAAALSLVLLAGLLVLGVLQLKLARRYTHVT